MSNEPDHHSHLTATAFAIAIVITLATLASSFGEARDNFASVQISQLAETDRAIATPSSRLNDETESLKVALKTDLSYGNCNLVMLQVNQLMSAYDKRLLTIEAELEKIQQMPVSDADHKEVIALSLADANQLLDETATLTESLVKNFEQGLDQAQDGKHCQLDASNYVEEIYMVENARDNYLALVAIVEHLQALVWADNG